MQENKYGDFVERALTITDQVIVCVCVYVCMCVCVHCACVCMRACVYKFDYSTMYTLIHTFMRCTWIMWVFYLQSGKPHQLTQFQIQNWDPQGRCSNPQAITAVVEEVFKVQRRTDNKPIVVHCRSAAISHSTWQCPMCVSASRPVTLSVGRACSVP